MRDVETAPESKHHLRAHEQGRILLLFFTSTKTCRDMARVAAAAAARCFSAFLCSCHALITFAKNPFHGATYTGGGTPLAAKGSEPARTGPKGQPHGRGARSSRWSREILVKPWPKHVTQILTAHCPVYCATTSTTLLAASFRNPLSSSTSGPCPQGGGSSLRVHGNPTTPSQAARMWRRQVRGDTQKPNHVGTILSFKILSAGLYKSFLLPILCPSLLCFTALASLGWVSFFSS